MPKIDRLFVEMHKKGASDLHLTSGFPPLLREIPDPPPFLYVRGELSGCPKPIAVVGSRNATAYGVETTLRICKDLAGLGFTVVSGMALGIDAAACRLPP